MSDSPFPRSVSSSPRFSHGFSVLLGSVRLVFIGVAT